jgi:hypothetical protein
MSVTHLESPRKSKLYTQGMIDGVDRILDDLYEDQDSPFVYKNTHKGIDHCINLLEHYLEWLREMQKTDWADYDEL